MTLPRTSPLNRPSLGAIAAVAALAAIVGMAPQAQAQDFGDIESAIIQGNQIMEAIDRTPGQRPPSLDDQDTVDGEAGIYILTLNDIFFIGGTAGIEFATNPARTVDELGSSASANGALSAGVRTRLLDTLDFGVVANVSAVEFFEDLGLSSRNINGAMQLGTQIAGTPLYVNTTVFGGYNFNEDFSTSISFYGASATLSAGLPITQRTVLQPSVAVTRQWSGLEENNNVAVAGGATLIHVLSDRVLVNVTARVTRSWFDDFFEDVTFVPRTDWQYLAGLGANYRVSEALTLSAGVSYIRRDSTFFLSSFDSVDGFAGVALNRRF